MIEPTPVTYRDINRTRQARNPDAVVVCNCIWDGGHEAHCDIVAANRYLRNRGQRTIEEAIADIVNEMRAAVVIAHEFNAPVADEQLIIDWADQLAKLVQ